MAKKSKIAKNEQRKKKVLAYAKKRAELRAILRSTSASDEEKDAARVKLQKLPRDANPIRVKNRCMLTGRPRGYYRKFGLSRIALREKAVRGELPGVTKSSW